MGPHVWTTCYIVIIRHVFPLILPELNPQTSFCWTKTSGLRSVHHHLWKTTYFAGNAVSFGEGTVFFYFAKTKKYIEVFANILEAQPPLVSGWKSPPNGRKFKPSSPPHLASARSLLCPCHANFAQLVLLTLWNGDLQSCIGTYKYRNKSLEIYFEYTIIFCSLQ